MKMNAFQFKLIKFFLEKTNPTFLVEEWKKYGVELELSEVCRVLLCNTFKVYSEDKTPQEDVLLAMFGV